MKPTSARKGLRELLEGVAERVVLDTESEGERALAIEVLEAAGFVERGQPKMGERTYSKVNGTRLVWWERSEG